MTSEIEPTGRPPSAAPSAWAASSIIGMRRARASAPSASRSAGCPAKSTGSSARVRGVIAASTARGSRHSVSRSTSTSTGRAPTCSIVLTHEAKVQVEVTTSSPGPTPWASSARWRPPVAWASATPWRAPARAATRLPSSSDLGPVVIQPDSSASSTSCFSRGPIEGRATGRKSLRTGVPPREARAGAAGRVLTRTGRRGR